MCVCLVVHVRVPCVERIISSALDFVNHNDDWVPKIAFTERVAKLNADQSITRHIGKFRVLGPRECAKFKCLKTPKLIKVQADKKTSGRVWFDFHKFVCEKRVFSVVWKLL